MKMQGTFGVALILSLSLVGCRPARVTETGTYHVDAEHFANMFADKFIGMGKAPPEARPLVLQQLEDAVFDLVLNRDLTFTAVQVIQGQKRTYKGTWTKSGTSIQLDQTHDNGQPLEDKMAGTLIDGKMSLKHVSADGELNFVLFHEASPAAPPR